jgi:hypothetical protein
MARPRCPECGEPVSPYAAGCALCGADLRAGRERRPRLPFRDPRLPRRWWPFDLGQTLFGLAILVLVIGAPVIGIVIALVVAADRHRNSEPRVRDAMLVLAALGVLQLFPSLALAPVLFRL